MKAIALALLLIGCGKAGETCVTTVGSGSFCLGDSFLATDQVLKVRLHNDCTFSCGATGSPSCQITRDGGFIQLQVVGQLCQPPGGLTCPAICRTTTVTCAIQGLPIGQYQIGSPGMATLALDVAADGGTETLCSE